MTDTQSATQSVTIGRTLGRYQLLASVARGGMGQVWLGRLQGARGFHKLVAIKTILATDEAGRFERMLLDEARIAALIHHPNVVETLELGEDDGTLFLVMEWVDGEPLSSVLTLAAERGGLPLPVAANLVAQTLRGLHAAHELCDEAGVLLGVVHRDVSPHNVLVSYTGAAKLLDFGIAKTTKRSSGQTVTGEVKGKFAYMAPEQVLGGTIDRRTDLFAVGIMLYTLTAGRHPFKHHNDAGVLHAITSEKPADRPSRFVTNYPPALEAVVMKAIDKDLEKRFATAEEMRVALEQAVPGAAAGGDARVRSFITELLADRAAVRREAVQRTLLRADSQTPSGGTPGLLQTAQSASSLRAVEVGRRPTTGSRPIAAPTSEPTVQRVDSRIPLRRSRRRYQTALLAAVAVAGAALYIAAKAALPREVPTVSVAEPKSVVAAAPAPVEAVPVVPSPPASATAAETSDAGAAEASVAPISPPRAQRSTPRAKRSAKAAEAGDLIAPDYAQ